MDSLPFFVFLSVPFWVVFVRSQECNLIGECIDSDVVAEYYTDTEKDCLKALTALDIDPTNLKVNKYGRPAGCYWLKGKGFFNKITDPNLTEPEEFGDRAGICKKPGKCSIYLRLLIPYH